MAYWRLFEPPLRSERDTDGVPRGTITGWLALRLRHVSGLGGHVNSLRKTRSAPAATHCAS
jgi:hypothetical protein